MAFRRFARKCECEVAVGYRNPSMTAEWGQSRRSAEPRTKNICSVLHCVLLGTEKRAKICPFRFFSNAFVITPCLSAQKPVQFSFLYSSKVLEHHYSIRLRISPELHFICGTHTLYDAQTLILGRIFLSFFLNFVITPYQPRNLL